MDIAKEFDEETIAKLLKGIEIPPQPQVLRIIMAEQQREYPDLRKIADAVAKDVGLSAAMLRAANSPAFGLRQKVTSISQAVMLLGIGNATSLVTGLSLRMVMSGKGKMKLDRFWDTAIDTALICSILAKRFNIMAPDQAYMLGLFHDCGIPMLMQRFPNYTEILREGNANTEEPITNIEDRELETNHAVVGYFVARSWFLPDEIRSVIIHHHDETILKSHGDNCAHISHVAFLTLAEHFSNLYHRASGDAMWERVGSDVMRIFNMTETCIYDLGEDMKDILSSL
ncbi:HDOD domain-containing protein [Gammaproteobacteria bacterium]